MSVKSFLKICVVGDSLDCHVQTRVKLFKDLGHEMSIVSPSECNLDGTQSYYIKKKNTFKPFSIINYIYRVVSKIREVDPDIVHLHYASPYEVLACYLSGKPYVVSLMGSDILVDLAGKLKYINRELVKFGLKKSSLITSKSPYLTSETEKFIGSGKNIMNVVWGVDLEKYKPSRTENENGEKIIFSPRAVKQLYNIDVIIKAMPLILSHESNVKLVLCDFNSDPFYKVGIEELIESLSLNQNIEWVPSIAKDDMPKFYNRVDVVVAIPNSDGFPQTLLEAMACGVPSVISDLPSYTSMMQHENNAVIVRADVNEVAEGVLSLLNDQVMYRKIVLEGLKTVRREANINNEALRVEKELKRLVSDFYQNNCEGVKTL